ncbi:MAG: PAS domain-containing protein [Sulfurovaceae bacterium]|nr:PAS domain-containing protein [Sulfurovaceae bacterium]
MSAISSIQVDNQDELKKPLPTGVEIKVDTKKLIVSKTDMLGKIIYGNDYFAEISGYKESEIIHAPHNILRHPDMPKAIFYMMWKHLKAGRNIMAVVKNMTKYGNHYWVTTDFDIKKNSITGKPEYYIAFRQAAPRHVVEQMEKIYAKMLEIEHDHGMEASVIYFESYLEEKGMNYDQFIEDLAKPKGLKAIIFEKMKKIFS